MVETLLGGDNADIKSVGFALAFGVLVDVLVVRMAIGLVAAAVAGSRPAQRGRRGAVTA
jgi:hypothetical protein